MRRFVCETRHGLLGLAIAAALAGCAVGPDFKRPDAPQASDYSATPTPAQTVSARGVDGHAQQFVRALDIPAQWWTLFQSQPLDALVQDAITRSADVTAAREALLAAQENVRAQQGQYFPQISASFDPTRQKTGDVQASNVASNAQLYTLTTASLGVSFTPDIWGENRRSVENLAAQAQAQRFQLEQTYLTLTANVVNAAVQTAALEAQVQATQSLIDSQQQIIAAGRAQLLAGDLGRADIAGQETILTQAQAALPPLQKALDQSRDLQHVLAARAPSDALPANVALDGLQLPAQLPLSLPAQLVEQRPDVRMAEANLHAACAAVGVAFAQRLPNIDITANGGSAADQLHDLFGAGGGFWNLGADISMPLFDAGTLKHHQRAAEAQWRQAAAQYRSTVMSALQNVADALHAAQADAQALEIAGRAHDAAAHALAIARKQYAVGDISKVATLGAVINERSAALSLIQARAARYSDSVALFQAAGGGWWHRDDTQASSGAQSPR